METRTQQSSSWSSVTSFAPLLSIIDKKQELDCGAAFLDPGGAETLPQSRGLLKLAQDRFGFDGSVSASSEGERAPAALGPLAAAGLGAVGSFPLQQPAPTAADDAVTGRLLRMEQALEGVLSSLRDGVLKTPPAPSPTSAAALPLLPMKPLPAVAPGPAKAPGPPAGTATSPLLPPPLLAEARNFGIADSDIAKLMGLLQSPLPRVRSEGGRFRLPQASTPADDDDEEAPAFAEGAPPALFFPSQSPEQASMAAALAELSRLIRHLTGGATGASRDPLERALDALGLSQAQGALPAQGPGRLGAHAHLLLKRGVVDVAEGHLGRHPRRHESRESCQLDERVCFGQLGYFAGEPGPDVLPRAQIAHLEPQAEGHVELAAGSHRPGLDRRPARRGAGSRPLGDSCLRAAVHRRREVDLRAGRAAHGSPPLRGVREARPGCDCDSSFPIVRRAMVGSSGDAVERFGRVPRTEEEARAREPAALPADGKRRRRRQHPRPYAVAEAQAEAEAEAEPWPAAVPSGVSADAVFSWRCGIPAPPAEPGLCIDIGIFWDSSLAFARSLPLPRAFRRFLNSVLLEDIAPLTPAITVHYPPRAIQMMVHDHMCGPCFPLTRKLGLRTVSRLSELLTAPRNVPVVPL